MTLDCKALKDETVKGHFFLWYAQMKFSRFVSLSFPGRFFIFKIYIPFIAIRQKMDYTVCI